MAYMTNISIKDKLECLITLIDYHIHLDSLQALRICPIDVLKSLPLYIDTLHILTV